jgi:hypothetical protein
MPPLPTSCNNPPIQALLQRALLTLEYFVSVQEFPLAFMYRDTLERTAASGDLRKMRLAARDIDEMAIGLEQHQRDGLEAILRDRLGIDKDLERAQLRNQVAKILERGTIASEKERQRLERYAEMLEATGSDPAEVDAVRRVLSDN